MDSVISPTIQEFGNGAYQTRQMHVSRLLRHMSTTNLCLQFGDANTVAQKTTPSRVRLEILATSAPAERTSHNIALLGRSAQAHELPYPGHNRKAHKSAFPAEAHFITSLSMMNFWQCSLLLLVVTYDHAADAQIELVETAAGEFRPARIVGGDPAAHGKYPYFCVTSPGALCGCSLIYPDVIITAAHCRGHLGHTDIYLGGINADRSDTMEIIFAGDELVHPNFDSVSLDNDIMLVQLTERSTLPTVSWNDNAGEPTTNEVLTAIGMGKISSNGPRAEMLLEVDVAVVSNADCSQIYTGITDNMFCAGGEPGMDSCFGDSGSPILNADGLMVGIVSWGPTGGCGLDGFPGVYARTSRAQQFIRDGICELSSTPPPYCFEEKAPETSPVAPPAPVVPTNAVCGVATKIALNAAVAGSTVGSSVISPANSCGVDSNTPGVWYRVKGTGGTLRAKVTNANFPAKVSVYQGFSCKSLQCLASPSSGDSSTAEFQSTDGKVYWVAVHGEQGADGDFAITITEEYPPLSRPAPNPGGPAISWGSNTRQPPQPQPQPQPPAVSWGPPVIKWGGRVFNWAW